ncbi:MAG: hypothetical protein KGY99_04540 [Phycisphaerae bacterium]|nr:hypothetical protein [Phycisphaerae bacterium]
MDPKTQHWTLLAAIILAQAAVAPAELIEGFENPAAVDTVGGKLSAVSGGQGLTEGTSAGQLPAGATVRIPVPAAKLSAAAWLKLDVAVVEPVTCAVHVGFRGTGLSTRRRAYMAPGAQCLALPLSVPLNDANRDAWPDDGNVVIEFGNDAQAPLIVDNLRLEPPAEAPPGATLVDFGDPSDAAWPGFAPAGITHPLVIWSGEVTVRDGAPGFPDPLGGDFVGARLTQRAVREVARLRLDAKGPHRGWLWVTHYANRWMPPMEYGLRNGDALVHERHSPAAMLSTQGLLRGRDGDWTPQWFADTHAERFVRLVELGTIRDGEKLALLNCQLAAAVVAPAEQREALDAYVTGVETDLRRYRRQFVVGRTVHARCTVAPSDGEQSSGLMVFRAGGERRFAPDFSPQESDRLERLELHTAPGLRTVGVVALAPVDDAAHLSAALETLRNAEGRPLLLDADATTVEMLATVPRVADGQVGLYPWIRRESIKHVTGGDLVYAVISVAVRDAVRPGTYEGFVRVKLAPGAARVPIRVRVHACKPRAASEARLIALSDAGADEAHRALIEALPNRRAADLRSRTRAIACGLDGLLLQGPTLSRKLRLRSRPIEDALATYPREAARGPTLFDARQALGQLRGSAHPRTSAAHKALRGWTAAVRRQADGTLRGPRADFVGWEWNVKNLKAMLPKAAKLRAVGGRPAICLQVSDLAAVKPAQRAALLRPYRLLILYPDHARTHDVIAHYKRTVDGGKVYLMSSPPDRYVIGFYAAAVDADGACLSDVYMSDGGPYDGFHVRGRALLVPQDGGAFAHTLATVVLQQGRSDGRLLRRAMALLTVAEAAGADAAELDAVVADIRRHARSHAGGQTAGAFNARGAVVDQLDDWRRKLLRTCQTVQQRLDERAATPQ